MMKIEKSTELSALNDPERVKYLGVIDTLRELGVNEEISLPQVRIFLWVLMPGVWLNGQLVVVGDQSSGKSSLLESLTGLSFPVASDLCTRFATEIVLRRSPPEEASARISLVPGSSSVDDENARAQLAKFTRLLNKNEIGSLDIGQTVAEVCLLPIRFNRYGIAHSRRLLSTWVFQRPWSTGKKPTKSSQLASVSQTTG